MCAAIPAQPSLPYYMASGDHKDKHVAVHGPNGHIASGLTVAQAKPIIDELNHLYSLAETLEK